MTIYTMMTLTAMPNDDGDGDDGEDNTYCDAKSVSRDSLQGDVVELPGNSLSSLNINMVMIMRMMILMMVIMMLMMSMKIQCNQLNFPSSRQ